MKGAPTRCISREAIEGVGTPCPSQGRERFGRVVEHKVRGWGWGGRSWSAGVTVGVSGKGCHGGADKVLGDWD